MPVLLNLMLKNSNLSIAILLEMWLKLAENTRPDLSKDTGKYYKTFCALQKLKL